MMFEIKLRAWKDSLDAHRTMEAFMTEKMDAQYVLIDSLQDKWHGAAANMFRERYLYMLRNGKYAKIYSHIRRIRQMMEEYLPKLVNLTSKCEQLPEQLDYDYYSVPWNIFNENIYYNDGYLYLDINYKGNIDFLCDEIHEKNQAARNLLDDIMDECGDLINFSEEREWNEQAFRKINRVQNFRLAFDDFATQVERLDEEMAEYFQYITACNQSEEEQRTARVTELPQVKIEKVQNIDLKTENGWDALVEGFMDSWLGEGITVASTAANSLLSPALVYKTAIDMKCRDMTLEESLVETEEFAKGYVQSVPKVAGELVQGVMELPTVIQELPNNIQELRNLIDEYGIKAVTGSILESTEESVKKVWNEEVVNGTARSRGEVAGRTIITVAELALSVKGLKDWLSKGKKIATKTDELIAGMEKVEDVIDETGDTSNDVKQASKVMDEIQDTVDDVKPVESGIGEGGTPPVTVENKNITGMDWYDYFRETYGKKNVCWENCNPSEVATAWQGSYPYVGVDTYTNTTLYDGDIIWMGEPFPTGYSTTTEAIADLCNDAQKVFSGLQVKPYYEKGMLFAEYRSSLTPYKVHGELNVAEGFALNNPQFGAGGLAQRFDPNFDYNYANGFLERLEEQAIELANTKVSLEDYFNMMDEIK